jgi:plasmid stabilization system protein ParE
MAFRVRLLASAQADAAQIYERVTAAAPVHGPLWYNRLITAIESLREFPRRCGHAPEDARFPSEIRHLLFGRKPNVYRVLFTIDGDTVYVLRIRGPRQQWLKP